MTDFHVNVVRITNVSHHPNGDRLDIINVHDGFPCIVERDKFKVGDLGIYVPIETTLPEKHFEFLSEKERQHLRAKKIRGIFSMGLLINNIGNWEEGQDVASELGITRYEPRENFVGGRSESPPQHFIFPEYTDIENLRKYHYVFQVGEEVVLHEKIHGANGRYIHDGKRLWVGSHTQIKKDLSTLENNNNSTDVWWKIAKNYNFENKLSKHPNKIFYGEVYGRVQDLKYGLENDVQFMLFDVFDINEQRYLNYDFALDIANDLRIPWVPEIYRGPWTSLQKYLEYAEGNTLLSSANNIREGFVMRPIQERWHQSLGRVIVKLHGEQFLLRKRK